MAAAAPGVSGAVTAAVGWADASGAEGPSPPALVPVGDVEAATVVFVDAGGVVVAAGADAGDGERGAMTAAEAPPPAIPRVNKYCGRVRPPLLPPPMPLRAKAGMPAQKERPIREED